ncbi:MAG: DUF2953 domain-containing protein [Clostridia bacterium]|nr:DUF2953 domain-containing protein [Clostridia bacterium]
MLAVYIILALLLLIGLLLIIPIKIHILIDEDFRVNLNCLFLKFRLYPSKKEDMKKATKEKAEKKNPSAIKTFTKNLIAEKGVTEALKELFSIIKELLLPFGPFVSKMVLNIKDFTVVVATPDAARTAITYGAVTGLVYDLLAVVDKKVILKKKNVRVYSDFLSDKSWVKANIKFSIRPITLFPLIKSLVKTYMNRILKPQNAAIKKGDVKNG